MTTRNLTGTLQVLAAATTWGCWSLFLRPSGLPSSVTTVLVLFVIGLGSLSLSFLDVEARWSRRSLWLVLGSGAVNAINMFAFFHAMQVATVAIAVLTHYFAPILVALGAPLIDRERIPGALGAALLALAGLVLLLEPWNNLSDALWLGAGLGLLSAFCYAANVFIIRRLGGGLGTFRAVGYPNLVSAIVLLPVVDWQAAAAASSFALALPALGGLISGVLGGWLFVRGLGHIGSSRTSILTFIEPVVACLVGLLFFAEPLGVLSLLGAGLIVLSGLRVSRP